MNQTNSFSFQKSGFLTSIHPNKISSYVLDMLKSKKLYVCIALLPVAMLLYYILKYTLNLPLLDDYQNTLAFALDFSTIKKWNEFLELLLRRQNYDHRLIINKIVVIASLLLGNKVNFTTLVLIGNISLFFILWPIFKIFKNKSWLILVPASVQLFQIQNYQDTITWSTNALQHAPTIACLMLSYYFIVLVDRPNIAMSLLFGLLATGTSSNGIIFFPMVMALLWFRGYKKSIVLVGLLFAITLYFYATDAYPADPLSVRLTANFTDKIVSFFVFMGAVFSFWPSLIIGGELTLITAIFMGIVLFIIILLLAYRDRTEILQNKQLLFLYSIVATLVGTMFLINFARNTPGIEANLAERYFIYGNTLIVLVLALVFYRKTQFTSRQAIYVVLSSGLWWVASYNFYHHKVIQNYQAQLADVQNFKNHEKILFGSFDNTKGNHSEHLNNEFYKIPEQYTTILPEVESVKKQHKLHPDLVEKYQIFEKNNDHTIIHFDEHDHIFDHNKVNNFLVCVSDTNTYYFNGVLRHVSLFYSGGRKGKIRSGFTASINTKHLSAGNYKVGHLVTKNGKSTIYWTDLTLKVPEK